MFSSSRLSCFSRIKSTFSGLNGNHHHQHVPLGAGVEGEELQRAWKPATSSSDPAFPAHVRLPSASRTGGILALAPRHPFRLNHQLKNQSSSPQLSPHSSPLLPLSIPTDPLLPHPTATPSLPRSDAPNKAMRCRRRSHLERFTPGRLSFGCRSASVGEGSPWGGRLPCHCAVTKGKIQFSARTRDCDWNCDATP